MNREKKGVVFSSAKKSFGFLASRKSLDFHDLKFKNLRNKRGGDNLLMKQIIVLIVIFALLAALLYFLVTMGSGELVKKEITAKQLCVIITGAENGTVINLTSNLIIEKNGQNIVVKKSTMDFGYSYDCNTNNFEIKKENANTIIRIGEQITDSTPVNPPSPPPQDDKNPPGGGSPGDHNIGDSTNPSLTVIAIPIIGKVDDVQNFEETAKFALNYYVEVTPLSECKNKFLGIIPEKKDYGSHWKNGKCIVPHPSYLPEGCYDYRDVAYYGKICADEYKKVTGRNYDFIMGIESISGQDEECSKATERHPSKNPYPSQFVPADNRKETAAQIFAHEIGHTFGLNDQYCDCTGVTLDKLNIGDNGDSYCGPKAEPNPLKKELGCDPNGPCCNSLPKGSPYSNKCKDCWGNYGDGKSIILFSSLSSAEGKPRSIMTSAGFYPIQGYSTEEYQYLKTQNKLKC